MDRSGVDPDLPTLPAWMQSKPQPPIPAVIGRFRVDHEIGRGGMGVVVAARDDELERSVAIKLVRTEAAEGDAGGARMLREAQALARLSHPNIVHVYEVGMVEGRMFIAMEHVDGGTLRQWLERSTVDWRDRLTMITAAGRGLAAAHAAGLVHRDFKPSNVLVGHDGRPRVADFGLARVQAPDASHEIHGEDAPARPDHHDDAPDDDTAKTDHDEPRTDAASVPDHDPALTRPGAVVGTLHYMAPEQRRGATADARSDQYSLCLVLYEGLFGVHPLAECTVDELLEGRVSIAAPPRHRGPPPRLASHVMRGLADDPADRWPSVDALLDALEFRTPRSRTMLVLGLVGATTVGVTAVLASGGGTSPCSQPREELRGVWGDERIDTIARAIDASPLGFAQPTWDRAQPLLEAHAAAWAEVWAQGCDAHRRGALSSDGFDRRLACLDTRRAELDAAASALLEPHGDALAQAVEAAHALPSPQLCADDSRVAVQFSTPDDPTQATVIADLRRRLARIHAQQRAGHYAQAHADAIAVQTEADATGHPPVRVEAALRKAELDEYLGDYATAASTTRAAFALAEQHQLDTLALRAATRLVGLEGDRLRRLDSGRVWATLAEARQARDPAPSEIAALLATKTGALHTAAGQHEVAHEAYVRALELRRAVYPDPHPRVADALDTLAESHRTLAQLDDADRLAREALTLREQILGPEHPDLAISWQHLALIAAGRGDREQARTLIERAHATMVANLGEDHYDVAVMTDAMGDVAEGQGRYDDAKRHYERALAIYRETVGPEHPVVGQLFGDLCVVALGRRDYEGARPHAEAAIAILEARLGPHHPSLAVPLNGLGSALQNQGALDEAAAVYERALQIRRRALGPAHPSLAIPLGNLAHLAMERERFETAVTLFREALEIESAALGPDHPDLSFAWLGMGYAEVFREHYEAAIEPMTRAYTLRDDDQIADDLRAETELGLARALWGAHRQRDRATALAHRALTRIADVEHSGPLAEAIEEWMDEAGVPPPA